jgi:hypothetical protein
MDRNSTNVRLNLVVIRSRNIEQVAEFYPHLGLSLINHQHGNSLEHFACELESITFEIFPCPIGTARIAWQERDWGEGTLSRYVLIN